MLRGGNNTDAGLPFLTIGGDGDLAYYGSDNRAVDRFGKALPQLGRYGETAARILPSKLPLAPVSAYTVLPAGHVETSVLQTAGARPWDRAPDDIRVRFFVAEGRGDIIDDEHQVGNGYPHTKEAHTAFAEADWNLDTMTPKSDRYPGEKPGAQEKLSPRDAAMRMGGFAELISQLRERGLYWVCAHRAFAHRRCAANSPAWRQNRCRVHRMRGWPKR